MNLPQIAAATAALAITPLASAQTLDWIAPPGVTVLDTDSTTLQPTTGPAITVTGGVFVFRNVTIPNGSTVIGRGSRPMVWITTTMQVDGRLSVDGEDGEKVLTLNAPFVPATGGRGGAAGGDGGRGSPQIALRSLAGQPGNGPGNTPGLGGGGGLLASPQCALGSGGGGGAFATIGDPWFKAPAGTGTAFVQRGGIGGFGCGGISGAVTRTLVGGGPGGTLFVDARADNDFFGLGFDVSSGQPVPGELTQLVGGAGGGGGGDIAFDAPLLSPAWINDNKGGGGGGGGGALLVFASTDIVVGPGGRVTANGGNGGSGELGSFPSAVGNNAGGGGGSGGLLILAALGQIVLEVKGGTYANNNFDFVLSADGGICTTSGFPPNFIFGKYELATSPSYAGNYDRAPLGGFGGMGIVQLAAPSGTNQDGTNTVLDDNIVLRLNGVPLQGAQKRAYLAWRGYRNAQGVLVDDFGAPTNINGNEGDIRPAPVLLRL
ncbi:MAG: hypothetical protein MUC36_08935 [Planctomycetes bacterium]|jgi:hypothetical protein|nr:hypothetical protein [Planctomycetota bacterium]